MSRDPFIAAYYAQNAIKWLSIADHYGPQRPNQDASKVATYTELAIEDLQRMAANLGFDLVPRSNPLVETLTEEPAHV